MVRSSNTSSLSIGNRPTADPQFKEAGARLKILYDNLDDANFPTEGRVLQFDYYASLQSLGANAIFRKVEVNFQDNLTIGSNTFSFAARYGRALKDENLSVFNQYSLGGFLQMSAFRPGEIRGDAVAYGRLSYYRRLGQFSNPFGRSMYAGVTGEFARSIEFPAKLGDAKTRNSLAAFVGVDTLIGPLYLGYGRTRDRDGIFYLFLGQP